MMIIGKYKILIILGVVLLSTQSTFSQRIENVRAEQKGEYIYIYYDIDKVIDNQTFDIKIYCSINGGSSWGKPLSQVRGEVGENISGGNSKKIVWDVLNERNELVGSDIKFKVKAHSLVKPISVFKAYPLNRPDKLAKTTAFKNDEAIYLYFKSPENGYLSVFLDDNQNSFRLLPYQEMTSKYEKGIPVIANKEYVFFSTDPEYDYFDDEGFEADIYELVAETNMDINKLYVIFSKNPFNKSTLKDNVKTEFLTELEKNQGYTVPKALTSEKFQKWLTENKLARKDIHIEVIDITISK